MAFLQKLLFTVARRIAADPRARDKAKRVFESEIKPRAQQAGENLKSEIDDIARDTNLKREPARFAGRLARRVIDRAKGK